MVGITQEMQIISIKAKTDAISLEKMNINLYILRLFQNINIKHYNIMNIRKINLRLIENIIIQVSNMASISKGILLHVSMFLEKMIFQLMSEIIK